MPLLKHIPDYGFTVGPTFMGCCDVKIYDRNGRLLVVISECIAPDGSYADPGPSTTMSITIIATMLQHDLPRRVGIWVVHHPARGGTATNGKHSKTFEFAEEFVCVTFRWSEVARQFLNPRATPASRNEIERLVGASI